MKTMKVRIAVAIGADGSWNAAGWSAPDREKHIIHHCAIEGLDSGCRGTHWITADVPVPEETEIKGQVEA